MKQERLPDELVQEIRDWRRRLKADHNLYKSEHQELDNWLTTRAAIIWSPKYADHVAELHMEPTPFEEK